MPSLAQGMEAGPGPDSLAYWLQPFKKYFERQGMLANEGLAQADQGAQQMRGGDLGGLAGMFLGPLGYLSSPVTALLPTESEVYNAPDLPGDAKPLIAGGLLAAGLALPGPKLGRGLGSLADDVTDAERAALASRLEAEAGQVGGVPSAATRDEALAAMMLPGNKKGMGRPAKVPQVWGPKFDVLMGEQYRMAEAGSDLSTMYDILQGKLSKASGIEPEMRAAMQAKVRELHDAMGPEGRRLAGIADETPSGITAYHGSPQLSLGERAKAAWGKADETRALVAELESVSAAEVAEIAKSLGLRVAATKKGNIQQIGGASMQVIRDRDIAERIRRGQ